MNDYIEIRLEGGELALPVEIGGAMAGWGMSGNEKPRKCARCGAEFVPNSRNQKYCDECKGKRVR